MIGYITGSAYKRTWHRWLWRLFVLLPASPVILILIMRWVDPLTSSFIMQRQLSLLMEGSPEQVKHEWVDAENITPHMKLAVVAAEDQKFPTHFGFDVEAIEKAMEHNKKKKKIRGASTISQQVAKNLFLWPSRSLLRKGLEAYLTAWIEICWPKQRILEVYLNIAQFDDNVFGVASASEQLFKTTPAALSTYQSALLAAVLPNPVRYRAEKPSPFVQRRANWIQGQMSGLGLAYLETGVVPVRMRKAIETPEPDVPAEEPVEEPLDVAPDAEATNNEAPAELPDGGISNETIEPSPADAPVAIPAESDATSMDSTNIESQPAQ
jgi:monofunctional biosynthetic peptidoglycan transglycosylase